MSRFTALLDDLRSADSMYYQMMETQANATGSAVQENEEYLKSFKARIAEARRMVEELALALGKAFLNESMMQGLRMFSSGVKGIAAFVEKFGALGAVMTTVGIGIVALSGKFRAFLIALTSGTSALTTTQLAMTGLDATMARTAVTSSVLAASFRAIGVALGFGIVLGAVGFAMEKLLGHMSKGREEADGFKNSVDEMTESYKANQQEVNRLAEEYKQLEESQKTGMSADGSIMTDEQKMENMRRTAEVQKELAQLIPEMKVAEDEYGNAVYMSSEQLERRNEILAKRIELEEKKAQLEQEEQQRDYLTEATEKLENYEQQIEKTFSQIENRMTTLGRSLGGDGQDIKEFDVGNILEAQAALALLEEQYKIAKAEGDEQVADRISETMMFIEEQILATDILMTEMQMHQLEIAEVYGETVHEIMENNEMFDEQGQRLIATLNEMMAESTLTQEEMKSIFDALAEGLNQDEELQKIVTSYQNAMKKIADIQKREKLGEIIDEKELQKNINNAEKQVEAFQKYVGKVFDDVNIDTSVFQELLPILEASGAGLTAFAKSSDDAGDSAESTADSIDILKMGLEGSADAGESTAEALNHVEEAISSITGTTFDAIDSVNDLFDSYESLNNILETLTEGSEEYRMVQEMVNEVEHELIDTSDWLSFAKDNLGMSVAQLIPMLYDETEANDILQSAIHDVANGTATAGQKRVISGANASKVIIDNLKAEIEAHAAAAKALGESIAIRENAMRKNPKGYAEAEAHAAKQGLPTLADMNKEYAKMEKEMRAAVVLLGIKQAQLRDDVSVLESMPTYSGRQSERAGGGGRTPAKGGSGGKGKKPSSGGKGKKPTSSKGSGGKGKGASAKQIKENATEMEKASFIADEYARVMEIVNQAISQQQAIKSKFASHSKTHQEALKEEIELEKYKLELMQAQHKELSKFLKDGKVPPSFGVTTHKKDDKPAPTVPVQNSPVVTGQRKLSGWQAGITSGYGYRTHPIFGNRRMHEGVDIGESMGKRLESNIEGIVERAFYHNSYGNVVFLKDAQGRSHRYAHLSKLGVQAGQKVGVGDYLGNIGSTGNSTGAHLHYEVRVNGTPINPMQWVNAAKGVVNTTSYSGSGNATGIQNVTNGSKEVAEASQQLFDLEGNILKLQGDIFEQQMKIEQLQVELMRAELDSFDQRKDKYEYQAHREEIKYDTLDKTSERYINVLKRQMMFMGYKQQVNEEELAHLDKLIKSGKYEGLVLDELTERYKELRNSISELNIELAEMQKLQIDGSLIKWTRDMEWFEFQLAKLDQTMRANIEGSDEWMKANTNKLVHLRGQQHTIRQEIEELQKLMRTSELLTPDMVEEYNKRLRELTLQYRELGLTIIDTEKQAEDARKRAWSEVAEKVIQAYKDAISEKRDMHLKSIDQEMKKENERHEKIMDQYQKELEAYRDIINEKLREIDREDRDRDFANEMEELDKNRTEILRQINILAMDDSREAKYKRKKLQEDLEKIDKDIENKRYKRQKDERKENLNEMLTEKEKELEEKERLETEYHDREIERIEDLREYWNQFYEDLLNDERKFAKMREDIMNENFDAIEAEFLELIDLLEITMPDLENTLDGTMAAVGTSIRQNIIDNLKEALNTLKEFQAEFNKGSSGGGIDLSAGLPSDSDLADQDEGVWRTQYSQADLKVITGKFIRDKMVGLTDNPWRIQDIKDHGSNLANQGRAEGSQIDNVIRYDALIKDMSAADVMALSESMMDYSSNFSTPEFRDYLEQQARRLQASAQSYDTGGFTGSWGKSGRLANLHQNELVLTEKETNKFGNLLSKFDGMSNLFNLLQRGLSSSNHSTVGDNVLNVNIESLSTSEEEVYTLTERINHEWTDLMRVQKGIK